VTDLPSVVDAAWVAEHLGEPGLLLADVRGPNAHTRSHIPGSIPLVLGSPAPVTDSEVLEALASEVGLRLRRHGVTGEERLVLYLGTARPARGTSGGGGDGGRPRRLAG
jgi:3-mercaptopyruvate sulfurtransferase SseA